MLTFELIQDLPRLRSLQPEWLSLAGRFPDLTPFQLPQWLLTWWRHLGGGSLRMLTFRHRGELVGVIPAFLHEWKGRRQLTLMGSGISDYLEPLVDRSLRCEIIRSLQLHLTEAADWDVCDWQDLSENTPLKGLDTGAGLDIRVQEDPPCSVIQLGSSFQEYMQSRPKDLKRNLRRYRAKAEPLGTWQFDVLDQADPESLDALIELHGARWKQSGQAGMIAANGSAEFIRDICATLNTENRVWLFRLQLNCRSVAVILTFRNSRTVFGYLSAFDPEYEAFGPGRELLWQALQYTHSRGYRQWDFLRGDEPYKFFWGAKAIHKCRLVISRKRYQLALRNTRPRP